MTTIKRIFITGAPGSMWSSVDRFIRYFCLPYVDNSDMTPSRSWRGHLGTYHNPGNEPFYDWILGFDQYSKEEIIEKLDSVYDPIPEETDFIIRTYKSHEWVKHFDKIETMFPEADIIATTNLKYKSLAWWQICGGVDTVFDGYDFYSRDLEKIWEAINTQTDLMDAWIKKHNLPPIVTNTNWLTETFGPPNKYFLRYTSEMPPNSDDGRRDALWANQSAIRNIANTTSMHIKYGTERRRP